MLNCPNKIKQGLATIEQCNRRVDVALLTCAEYLNAKNKCSKESDIPIIPKIVMMHPTSQRENFFKSHPYYTDNLYSLQSSMLEYTGKL